MSEIINNKFYIKFHGLALLSLSMCTSVCLHKFVEPYPTMITGAQSQKINIAKCGQNSNIGIYICSFTKSKLAELKGLNSKLK